MLVGTLKDYRTIDDRHSTWYILQRVTVEIPVHLPIHDGWSRSESKEIYSNSYVPGTAVQRSL